MLDKIKKYWKILVWPLIWLYYSAFSVIIYWDSAHYMSYVYILEGKLGMENWDIVRGPVFPYIIYFCRKILGKSNWSLIIITFISYAIMLFFVNLFLKKCLDNIKDKRTKNIFYFLTFVLIIFNPIILGYYHALLTELVALTLTIICCYLAWKWIDLDFFDSKIKYILYTILFSILFVFSWFLKQPYVAIPLFPFLIASVISIYQKFNLKNILQRIISLVLMIFVLINSNNMWYKYLSDSGLDLNTNRNVVQGFGGQLVTGSRNIRSVNDLEALKENYNNYEYLNSEEKLVLEKNIGKETNEFYAYNILNLDGDVIDTKVIDIEGKNSISVVQALSLIGETFVEHPIIVLDGYISAYLCLADLYEKNPELPTGLNEKLAFGCEENCTIGSGITEVKDNIYYMTDEMYEKVESYEKFNIAPRILRVPLRLISSIFQKYYSLSMITLPFLCIAVLLIRLIYNKKLNEQSKKEYNIIIIFLWFSFFNALVYVFTTSCIDRYVAVGIIPMVISQILLIKNFFVYIKGKSERG